MGELPNLTISIVTPSYNQARFVHDTIASVRTGTVAPDEYVVVDGGSTDGSKEIIEEFASELTWWRSAPDEGQYAAIDDGFRHTTGDVMGWINSDDLYMPWTLAVVKDIFHQLPEVEWLTTLRPLTADVSGNIVRCEYTGGFSQRSFAAGVNLTRGPWFARASIQQESTFWRRSLWERAGSRIDRELSLAGDFELWSRFFEHADLYGVDTPLAAFRVQPDQKTSGKAVEYFAEASRVLQREGAALGRGRGRKAVHDVLGRRSLRKLPDAVRTPLIAARLLHRVPTIVWSEEGWHVVEDYAV